MNQFLIINYEQDYINWTKPKNKALALTCGGFFVSNFKIWTTILRYVLGALKFLRYLLLALTSGAEKPTLKHL